MCSVSFSLEAETARETHLLCLTCSCVTHTSVLSDTHVSVFYVCFQTLLKERCLVSQTAAAVQEYSDTLCTETLHAFTKLFDQKYEPTKLTLFLRQENNHYDAYSHLPTQERNSLLADMNCRFPLGADSVLFLNLTDVPRTRNNSLHTEYSQF